MGSSMDKNNVNYTVIAMQLVIVMMLLLSPVYAKQLKTDKQPDHKVKYTVEDDFIVHGDYFPGHRGGVILLHGCERDRRSLFRLAQKLSEHGIHALNIDFRGFGDSTSELFSQQKIKRMTKDLVAYQNEMARYMSYWESDVLAGYHFLRAKVERDQPVSIVATGCGSVQAVALAEKVHIEKFVFVSPEMGYAEKERYKNLFDKPSYFVSSVHDIDRHITAHELFEWNGDKGSKFQMFKGSYSANSLINQNQALTTDIALWLVGDN